MPKQTETDDQISARTKNKRPINLLKACSTGNFETVKSILANKKLRKQQINQIDNHGMDDCKAAILWICDVNPYNFQVGLRYIMPLTKIKQSASAYCWKKMMFVQNLKTMKVIGLRIKILS
jgi:hypothetical protein